MAEQEESYSRRLKMIENGSVSPPVNSVPASSLPLSCFDIPWMLNFCSQGVSIYQFPLTNPEFTQKVVPALKSSLSISLKHFYPFAGKLVVPPLPDKPRIAYNEGDSVPFTVAEFSMEDFEELIRNDPQDVKLLHPFVPQLTPWHVSEEGICTRAPLLAIQVTLFPNWGMCLGMQISHAVCDARSLQQFMKSWASICRTGDLDASLLPFLDRRVIEDPNDVQTTLLKSLCSSKVASSHGLPPLCTDQRATFILSRPTINRLNNWIANRSSVLRLQPNTHISSFAAACAFTWVCIVKSNHEVVSLNFHSSNESQLCRFSFIADCRNRLETPVADTYFGNCLVACAVDMERKILIGQNGVVLAARAIAQKVAELENSRGAGILTWAEKCFSEFGRPRRLGDNLIPVAGSPQIDFYDTDFGWGRPKKYVMVHSDRTRSISLMKNRDEIGGMEIGVALTKPSMLAFTSLFTQLDSFVIAKL